MRPMMASGVGIPQWTHETIWGFFLRGPEKWCHGDDWEVRALCEKFRALPTGLKASLSLRVSHAAAGGQTSKLRARTTSEVPTLTQFRGRITVPDGRWKRHTRVTESRWRGCRQVMEDDGCGAAQDGGGGWRSACCGQVAGVRRCYRRLHRPEPCRPRSQDRRCCRRRRKSFRGRRHKCRPTGGPAPVPAIGSTS